MSQNRKDFLEPPAKSLSQAIHPEMSFFLAVVIVAVVAFAVYLNALGNGFIYDDHSQVLRNYAIRDARNIPELFLRSAWTFEGAPPTSNYYRPMLNLLYMLNYYLFGLQAWGYHLVNVLFHVGNTVLVFLLTSALLTGRHAEGQTPGPVRSSTFLSPPFIAALLFATTPIHIEAVTWIAGLSDVSFSFFFLLSFYLYVLSDKSRWWLYLFSLLSFSLSLLSKEPALMLPLILAAYDYAFGKRPLRAPGLLKRYTPYVLVACAYLIARYFVLGGFAPLKRLATLSTPQLIMTIFPLFSLYLRKLILPINLNFWPVISPIKTHLSTEGMLSLCATLIFVALMVATLRKKRTVFFCLILIAVPLAPALYIKGIIGKPFADRYLYLPSFGLSMLLAMLFWWIRERRRAAAVTCAAALAILAVFYSAGTVTRNNVWKDEYSLFADTVKKSPNSVVPRLEFGDALLERGRFDEAIEQFEAAARMEPMLYVIYYHLGLAFAGKGSLLEAIEDYRMALALNPTIPGIHLDLGRAYAKAGFHEEAVQELRIAVALQPSAVNHNLLGIAYAQNGEAGKAAEEFSAAIALDRTREDYQRNLSRAIAILKSPSGGNKRNGEFTQKFEEGPPEEQDIFRFAW
jgi:tetratricopeptide (TPR) repeat protein